MFKNYFYLLRLIKGLKPIILGGSITEIYTQEKDNIFMSIPLKYDDNFHIIISTSTQYPYITFKQDHRKAKKNTKNFFTNFLPREVQKIEIAFGDRIIRFNMTDVQLYLMIRGSKTNVILIDRENNIYPFKKIDNLFMENLVSELNKLDFIDSIKPIQELLQTTPKEEIIKNFKFIDKDIKQEIDSRTGDWKKNLDEIINEIYYRDISVFINENSPFPKMQPVTFASSIEKQNYLYNNYFESVNRYLSLRYSVKKEKILRDEIEKHIEKSLEKSSNKINELKARIDNGLIAKDYERNANLLLTNLHLLKKGMKEIQIEDFETREKVLIKLDEKLTPSQNVERFYDKAKSERINYEKSKLLFEQLSSEFTRFIKIKSDLQKIDSIQELQKIKKELNIKNNMQNAKETQVFNFRHFLIDNKYHLYVGKDSKNNDLLTLKFAKQNDYWFHARSVSGSHAVLRVDNIKEAIPKSILKKAASIAGFYSKAKTSKVTPVTYTLKKYVVKKKGMEPGKVALLKENVLLVPPEIPIECVIID